MKIFLTTNITITIFIWKNLFGNYYYVFNQRMYLSNTIFFLVAKYVFYIMLMEYTIIIK